MSPIVKLLSRIVNQKRCKSGKLWHPNLNLLSRTSHDRRFRHRNLSLLRPRHSDLRRHARYPEGLFSLQADVYGLYHMTRPEVFFNREDLWTVATETASDANGQQSVQPMQPNYVVMKLPGGTQEEFVQILPFTPANRNNLIGWIAGRSDGEAYGTTAVYNFPKTRLIGEADREAFLHSLDLADPRS